ncbi:hypothetical protein AB0M50_35915 [Nonomuraea fuscirosea]|jgi:hypothetical protein|uniref:hypothetical protein n=1 Tax=Nonomuraea fuscirosea TaxID=1291556 RepID=UPI003413469C
MTYPYQGEHAESLLAQGRLRGEARALLKFLAIQGIPVTEEVRERVMSCSDEAVLDDWLRRAIEAESVEDVFG